MSEIKTQPMELNMGPQHPSAHGVLRFILQTDGEIISKLTADIGYLHRGIEKIAERVNYASFMPYTDRIDYLAAANCNIGYAQAVERLVNIEVPERAQFLRVIFAEFVRIASHLIAVGCVGLDLGAVTPFVHSIRERETVNDLLEEVCGARLTYNYARIGGVSHDLPKDFREKALKFLDHLETDFIPEYDTLLTYNKIFIKRLANIAIVNADMAKDYMLVGPNLRASGVNWDLRKDDPYLIYPKVEFNTIVGKGWMGTVGDNFDRYFVRMLEMIESAKILRQCLEAIPEGEILGKVPRVLRPESGEIYDRTESARGELGYYLVSDGSPKPYRLKIRTGSFSAMRIIEALAPALMISDLVALIGSLDVIAPEIDR